jgi:hypothetical protein
MFLYMWLQSVLCFLDRTVPFYYSDYRGPVTWSGLMEMIVVAPVCLAVGANYVIYTLITDPKKL